MIERYEPFDRAMSLRQMMDRLLEDAFIAPRGDGAAGPSVDAYEEGDNLVVEAQLPGVRPEDVDVTVEQGFLTIGGRSEQAEEGAERNYLVRERRAGRFSRTLRLPATYSQEPSETRFEHGVLRLTFPKTEEAKPRRIPIAAGGARQGQQREPGQVGQA